ETSAALGAYDATPSPVLEPKSAALVTPELPACLQRPGVERRRQGAAEHAVSPRPAAQAGGAGLAGTRRPASANRPHNTPG
ncbi:hypothetical protein J8J19_23470, partial [Mycobacterium tuberculosis]|nr:hypothetical protein [Mycobacterium tuberculosis]